MNHCHAITSGTAALQQVALIGTGLIGGSIARALRAGGFRGTIDAVCLPHEKQRARALEEIDTVYTFDALEAAVCTAELIVICTPVTAILATLDSLATLPLRPGVIITDTGSTKERICTHAAKVLPDSFTFVGGHPMAGSEKSGPEAADPYLFQNAAYVLTPARGYLQDAQIPLGSFLADHLKCRIMHLEPLAHDRIAAAVSHVPHLLAIALMTMGQRLSEQDPQLLHLAAGGFRDMTRIASAPYDMWRDIFATNSDAIGETLRTFREELEILEQETLSDCALARFCAASELRSQIPANSKGFLNPLADCVVSAVDEPGFIARIATLLADASINIKDIEVLKVREGEGGTIRLGFESREIANNACTLLASHGIKVRAGELPNA